MENNNNELVVQFVELYKKIEDMDKNYIRNNLQKYTEDCNELNSEAAEIIKNRACEFQFKDDTVILTINRVHYYVQFDDVLNYFDIQELKNLMDEQHEKEREEERQKRREEKKEQEKASATSRSQSMPPQQMFNPFAAMASCFMNPFMGMGGGMVPGMSPDMSGMMGVSNDTFKALSDRVDRMQEELDNQGVLIETLYNRSGHPSEALKPKTSNNVSRRSEKPVSRPGNDEEVSRLNKKIEDLTNSLESAEKKIVTLSSHKSNENSGNDEDLNKKISSLEDELSRARSLAYTDHKYNVMNTNAYTDYLANCEKDTLTIAVCGISNTRQINQLYGRQSGDNVIRLVAEKLSELYGKENVYRNYGDQFFVLLENANSPKIKEELAKMQSELFNEKISISFGVVDAVTCNTVEMAVKQAEGEMNSMKVKNGSKQIISKEIARMKAQASPQAPAPEPDPEPEDDDPAVEEEYSEPESTDEPGGEDSASDSDDAIVFSDDEPAVEESEEVEKFGHDDVDVLTETQVEELREEGSIVDVEDIEKEQSSLSDDDAIDFDSDEEPAVEAAESVDTDDSDDSNSGFNLFDALMDA